MDPEIKRRVEKLRVLARRQKSRTVRTPVEFYNYGHDLSLLWYRLGNAVAQDPKNKKMFVTENPVECREFKVICALYDFGYAAHLSGLAFVYDYDESGQQVTLIGRRCNLDMFTDFFPTSLKHPEQRKFIQAGLYGTQTLALGRCAAAPNGLGHIWDIKQSCQVDRPTVARYIRGHDIWLGLKQIHKKITDVAPEFRDLQGRGEDVVYYPRVGKKLLGGCVWKPHIYTTKKGKTFLQFS